MSETQEFTVTATDKVAPGAERFSTVLGGGTGKRLFFARASDAKSLEQKATMTPEQARSLAADGFAVSPDPMKMIRKARAAATKAPESESKKAPPKAAEKS